jgi:hypothetical protein
MYGLELMVLHVVGLSTIFRKLNIINIKNIFKFSIITNSKNISRRV